VTFLGIDFSGSAGKWRPTVNTPTVWIAGLSDRGIPEVVSLMPVQRLPGTGNAFARLAALLSTGNFIAAGIDAPFSVPAEFIPPGGWRELIDLNGRLPHDGRPFPDAMVFLEALTDMPPGKPLRRTEDEWRRRGVNVRSTMWRTPQGGAPFAAACMTLIAMSGPRPCWPWIGPAKGMLVEAFPAARLRQWCMEHQGYNGPEGADPRSRIVDGLPGRVSFGKHETAVRESADALDAVLAAFAGIWPAPTSH
jgi:Protein of unknown function (DUF429)